MIPLLFLVIFHSSKLSFDIKFSKSFQIIEEPPSYSSSVTQRYESFENPLAGSGSQSFGSQDEERISSGNPQFGSALYDFTAGGDDEVI